jgi:hypothetical protein
MLLSYPRESEAATNGESRAGVYNWATQFLGNIKTGTWHSKLEKVQTRYKLHSRFLLDLGLTLTPDCMHKLRIRPLVTR